MGVMAQLDLLFTTLEKNMFSSTKLYNLLLIITILFISYVRLHNITSVPASLYWEEAALGYDAYSVLQTGKDHHGHFLPIFAFESFGDWKPAGYFYAIIPFIKFFGLTALSVRLPAAVSGIFLVILTAIIGKKLKLPFLLTLIISGISLWGIHFSRSGWEVMLATSCITAGILFFWEATSNEKIKLLSAVTGIIFFALSAYTYHAARIIAPVLCLSLSLIWFISFVWPSAIDRKKIANIWKRNAWSIFIIFLVSFALFAPLYYALLTKSELSQRYRETGSFFDLQIAIDSNNLRELAGSSIWSKFFYHRYIIWSIDYLGKIFKHFTIDFLAVSGDPNLRHGTGFMGIIYPADLVFLLVGLVICFSKIKKEYIFLLLWLLVPIMVAALAQPVPHALRILPSQPAFILLITLGIWQTLNFLLRQNFFKKITFRYGLFIVLFTAYLGQFLIFWKYYQNVYPVISSQDWQFGYQEMIEKVSMIEAQMKKEDPVYISRGLGRPAMYYWFFTKTDPSGVQQQNELEQKDQGEFITYKNKTFARSANLIPIEPSIVVAPYKEMEEFLERIQKSSHKAHELDKVVDSSGRVVWVITEVE